MNTTRKLATAFVVILGAWLGVTSGTVFAQSQKPNVVFILADNVGYGDLGPYGGGELRGAPTPPFSASAPLAGYPLIYNIEMDPHEDLVVGGLFGWTGGPPLEAVEKYKETLKKYPNPPAANMTKF